MYIERCTPQKIAFKGKYESQNKNRQPQYNPKAKIIKIMIKNKSKLLSTYTKYTKYI